MTTHEILFDDENQFWGWYEYEKKDLAFRGGHIAARQTLAVASRFLFTFDGILWGAYYTLTGEFQKFETPAAPAQRLASLQPEDVVFGTAAVKQDSLRDQEAESTGLEVDEGGNATTSPSSKGKMKMAPALKWQPSILGADVTSGDRQTSHPAVPFAPSNRVDGGRLIKRRKTEAGSYAGSTADNQENIPPSTLGISHTMSVPVLNQWPWTARLACNVRGSICSFVATRTADLQKHLKLVHQVGATSKATHYDAEGVKSPKTGCSWDNCTAELEGSSIRKHLERFHIGRKYIQYVCGYCGGVGLENQKDSHEQWQCTAIQR